MNNKPDKKPLFSLRELIRGAMIILATLVFCPMFLVSCGSEKIGGLSVAQLIKGLEAGGEGISPQKKLLIVLFIPITVFSILLFKKINEQLAGAIILVACSFDLGIWLFLLYKAYSIAKKRACTVDITGWYFANCLLLFTGLITGFLILIRKLSLDNTA